jgi:hypothetical protein
MEYTTMLLVHLYSWNANFRALLAFSIKTGAWVGDCFIYTNAVNRLNYLVGAQTFTISHFDTYVVMN